MKLTIASLFLAVAVSAWDIGDDCEGKDGAVVCSSDTTSILVCALGNNGHEMELQAVCPDGLKCYNDKFPFKNEAWCDH